MVNRDKTGGTIGCASFALLAVIGGSVGARTALGQHAAEVTVDIGECVKLEAPDERLACYGRHVDAAVKQNNAAPSTPPALLPAIPAAGSASASAPAAPPSSATAATPPRDSSAREQKPKSADGPAAESSSIVATVTALKETVPNAYLITLDNGQVWRQKDSQRYALQPGQRVTLSRTKWGEAYRLNAEGLHGFIQVERVR